MEHNFTLASLMHFGFGKCFIKWISALLRIQGNQACVLNNAYAANLLNIARGTRQGDPISPYLFILVIEILASSIRQNNQIKSIRLGTKQLSSSYSPTTAPFFLKDLTSLDMVLKSMNDFYFFSSLKINTTKSQVVCALRPQCIISRIFNMANNCCDASGFTVYFKKVNFGTYRTGENGSIFSFDEKVRTIRRSLL